MLGPHLRAAIEQLVDKRVQQRFAEMNARLVEPRSPWLYGAAAAADHLGWSREKIYKALPRLPHHRIGQRLAFRRDELDTWLDEHREGRGGARPRRDVN